MQPQKLSELIDRTRQKIRLRHLSYSTEKTYLHWIARYAAFINALPDKSLESSAKVEAFLTRLAVADIVSASTQNQALSALLFLYREVLDVDLGNLNALRAKRGQRVPVVLTHPQAMQLINPMHGDYKLITQLLYGSGLRLMECLRLRAKDIDLDRLQITVRDGKGDKDRITILPASLTDPLRAKIAARRLSHKTDLAAGYGAVQLPDAIARKYKNAPHDFGWQFLFASPRLAVDPRDGKTKRHHILPTNVQRQIKHAAESIQFDKPISPHALRHSFATRLLETGVPIHQVKELMGHKSIETTQIYLHTIEQSGHTITSPLDT